MKNKLEITLKRLIHHTQVTTHWPSDNDIEMMTSAILVQNTSWTQVEKVILGFPKPISGPELMSHPHLEEAITPCGSFNRKAATIRNLMTWYGQYDFKKEALASIPTPTLRKQLMSLHGIGQETADCILLYVFERPVFVVDTYLKRLLQALDIPFPKSNQAIQDACLAQLPHDVPFFQAAHLAILEYGKNPNPKLLDLPLIEVPFAGYQTVLQQEPPFQTLHDQFGYVGRAARPDPYRGFITTIISQLLSVQVADVLATRFFTQYPTIESLFEVSIEEIKAVGLTQAKAHAIYDLASQIKNGSFDFKAIHRMSDEAAIQAISALRGLGKWSANIILMHTYQRLDLTTYDDLGLRKQVARLLQQETVSVETFQQYMLRFAPYRTIANIFLWRLWHAQGGQK